MGHRSFALVPESVCKFRLLPLSELCYRPKEIHGGVLCAQVVYDGHKMLRVRIDVERREYPSMVKVWVIGQVF